MKTVRCVTGSSYLSPFSEGAYHLLACQSGPSGFAELSQLHNGVKQRAYCQQLISASHSISHYSHEHMAWGM